LIELGNLFDLFQVATTLLVAGLTLTFWIPGRMTCVCAMQH